MRLKDKVAIVTGSGRGIGRGIARVFAREGAKVVLAARTQEQLDRTLKEIELEGGIASSIITDVAVTQDVKRMVEFAVEKYGQLNILVNNAGAAKNAGVLDMTDDEWNFTMDADLTSVFKVTRAFAKYMKEN